MKQFIHSQWFTIRYSWRVFKANLRATVRQHAFLLAVAATIDFLIIFYLAITAIVGR